MSENRQAAFISPVQQAERMVCALAAKGAEELGIIRVAAELSNAIFHAIGKHVRSIPMTPENIVR